MMNKKKTITGLQNCIPGKMYFYAGSYVLAHKHYAPSFPYDGVAPNTWDAGREAQTRWENVVAFHKDSLFFIPNGAYWKQVILTEVDPGIQLILTAG